MNLLSDLDFMYYFQKDAEELFPHRECTIVSHVTEAMLTIAPYWEPLKSHLKVKVSGAVLQAIIEDDPAKKLFFTVEDGQNPRDSAHYFLTVLQDYVELRKTQIVTATVEAGLLKAFQELIGLPFQVNRDSYKAVLMDTLTDLQSCGYLNPNVTMDVRVNGHISTGFQEELQVTLRLGERLEQVCIMLQV